MRLSSELRKHAGTDTYLPRHRHTVTKQSYLRSLHKNEKIMSSFMNAAFPAIFKFPVIKGLMAGITLLYNIMPMQWKDLLHKLHTRHLQSSFVARRDGFLNVQGIGVKICLERARCFRGRSTATASATTATATATATAQQVWASMCVNRTQLEPFKTSGSGQRLCEFDTASKERAGLS